VKRRIFIDTVYLLGLLNPRDRWHGKAVEMSATVRGPFVTSDAVLTEVADAVAHRSRRKWACEAVADLRADPDVTCVCIDGATFGAGLQLYQQMVDKDWSLTDCLSFAIMRREQITDVLTADVHFVQAGFRALMRD
jgi:predicted nucleic acid-binding protein